MSQADFGPYLECSIALAVDLVNTFVPVDGHEDLSDPASLASFIKEHLVSFRPTPSKRDLEEVRTLRESLREVFLARDPETASGVLNSLLSASDARPELTNHGDGPWHLHFTPPGANIAPHLAAETAMALAVVVASGDFERLRVCEGHDCVDVFVDESRNRSRLYCSPEICGNRASVAAYRARRKVAAVGEPLHEAARDDDME